MKHASKQLTIFVLPSMEADLKSAKETHYRDHSSSEMLRDLILRGLAASKALPSERSIHYVRQTS